MKIFRRSLFLCSIAWPSMAAAAQLPQTAFVWADRPEAGVYEPNTAFSRNIEDITISRSGVGAYSVDLGENIPGGRNRGNIQVTAYGEDAVCNPFQWNDGSVKIACFGPDGARKDTRYTVLHMPAGAESETAFARVFRNDGGEYFSSMAYSQTDEAGTVRRTGMGRYILDLGDYFSGGGNVQVSATDNAPRYCTIGNWSNGSVGLSCFDMTGAPADSKFSVLFTGNETSAYGTSFVWANEPAAASYAPNSAYAHSRGAVKVNRSQTGVYQVWLPEVAGGGGNVQVSAYGSNARCRVNSWGGGRVNVACVAPNGAPVDSRFSLLFKGGGAAAPAVADLGVEDPPQPRQTPLPAQGVITPKQGVITTAPRPAAPPVVTLPPMQDVSGRVETRTAMAQRARNVFSAAVEPGAFGQAAALSKFRLKFRGSDHKIRHMGVMADDRFARFAFADQDSNDNFDAEATWLNAPRGVSGEVSALGAGRIELPIDPGPADHTLVLTGFEFQRKDGTDANVRTLGVDLDAERNVISAVLIDDMGLDWRGFETTSGISALLALTPLGITTGPILTGDVMLRLNDGKFEAQGTSRGRPYGVTVQYAWIPNDLVVVDDGAKSGLETPSSSYRSAGDNVALQSFLFTFMNSDHHLQRLGIDLSGGLEGGRAVMFSDSDFGDPMQWAVEYVTLRR